MRVTRLMVSLRLLTLESEVDKRISCLSFGQRCRELAGQRLVGAVEARDRICPPDHHSSIRGAVFLTFEWSAVAHSAR